VFVGLILILQLGAGIAAYLMVDPLEAVAEKELMSTMNQYNNETHPDIDNIRRSWDLVQSDVSSVLVKYFDGL